LKGALQQPEKFVAQFRRGLKYREERFVSSLVDAPKDNPAVFGCATLLALDSAAIGEPEYALAESLLDYTTDPQIFAVLWDIVLAKPAPKREIPREEKLPSLVASFQQSGTLDEAEELAHAARQPFCV
jgi:hypothetical protein